MLGKGVHQPSIAGMQNQPYGFFKQRRFEVLWLIAAEEIRHQWMESPFLGGVHHVFWKHGTKEAVERGAAPEWKGEADGFGVFRDEQRGGLSYRMACGFVIANSGLLAGQNEQLRHGWFG